MKNNKNAIIFSTIHGSHLYGLAEEWSDIDLFVVDDSPDLKVRHEIVVNNAGVVIDTATVGINAFLTLASGGSHQSVEALFSRDKVHGPGWVQYGDMLEGMRIQGSDVFEKYERTIKKFSHGDFKRRRHAARLALNLKGLRMTGRFDPKMNPVEASIVSTAAKVLSGDALIRELV